MRNKGCKLKIFKILILLSFITVVNAEDYQYQYFNKKKRKYTPFSDYIPRIRLHYQTVPHYLEDYYQLYGMKLYYNENTLRKNIARLKTALQCNFRHPSQALVKVTTSEEYKKYRNLMFMHINLLIMRSYLKIAARYDMRNIYFYHSEFAKEINDSLDIAERLYKEATPYWREAKKYAQRASTIKITTDLGFIESERYSIIHNELNYDKIINTYLNKVKRKKEQLQKAIK